MSNTELVTNLHRIADCIEDHDLLDVLLATINPYARGGAFTETELANVTRAQVQIVNRWRKQHNIIGGVLATTPPESKTMAQTMEFDAFKAAEKRLHSVQHQMSALLGEVTRHLLALEAGTRVRERCKQEQVVAAMLDGIDDDLARVGLLMREDAPANWRDKECQT